MPPKEPNIWSLRTVLLTLSPPPGPSGQIGHHTPGDAAPERRRAQKEATGGRNSSTAGGTGVTLQDHGTCGVLFEVDEMSPRPVVVLEGS